MIGGFVAAAAANRPWVCSRCCRSVSQCHPSIHRSTPVCLATFATNQSAGLCSYLPFLLLNLLTTGPFLLLNLLTATTPVLLDPMAATSEFKCFCFCIY
jgi:hypothetical protein